MTPVEISELRQLAEKVYVAAARFLLYWAGAFGFFATTTNCPCCGQPGCPAGAAGLGVLAGIVAGAASFFRRALRRQGQRPPAEAPEEKSGPQVLGA